MAKTGKGRTLSVWVSILAVLYVAGSLIAIHSYRQALETEKERVYSIADHLELWKEITVKHNGYLDPKKLANDPRNIDIALVERTNGSSWLNAEDKLYSMFHSKLDEQRKEKLKRRYFSDLVLSNYFYIITDKNGKIKEMSWDK